MATPPHVSRAELAAAVDRVLWRHRHVDDPRRAGLGTGPREILEHLTRHSVGLPRWVAGEDTLDALVLSTWLWWEDRRRERALLRRGLHLGLTSTELGGPLGITTRQGLRDRLDRLDALLEFDRPDEKLTRAARRAAADGDRRRAWIHAHRDRIRAVLTTLLAQLERLESATGPGLPPGAGPGPPGDPAADPTDDPADELDAELDADTDRARDLDERDPGEDPGEDEDDWAAELRADLAGDQLTPATLSLLGLLLAQVRPALRRADLAPSHGLPRAVRAAERLRADFARAPSTEPEQAQGGRVAASPTGPTGPTA